MNTLFSSIEKYNDLEKDHYTCCSCKQILSFSSNELGCNNCASVTCINCQSVLNLFLIKTFKPDKGLLYRNCINCQITQKYDQLK